MKVNSLNSNNYEANCQKRDVPTKVSCLDAPMEKDSVSFCGIKSATGTAFDKIGTNFFTQFLVIDTLSLVIPRIIIGLSRDHDKTGKINYKAGAEEAGREVLSGPSMGIIPMACLAASTYFAPAAHMHADTLKAITSNMHSAVKNVSDVNDFANKEKLNKKLGNELFDNAFADFELDSKARAAYKEKFVNLLHDSTGLNAAMFKNHDYKQKANEFEKLVMEINTVNKKTAPVDSRALTLSFAEQGKDGVSKVGVEAKDFFKDFHNYSKDILDKLSKESFVKETLGSVKTKSAEFLNAKQLSRARIKQMTVVGAFLAVGIFLLNLPKLYQQGKVSPAMESAKRAQAESQQGGANENK